MKKFAMFMGAALLGASAATQAGGATIGSTDVNRIMITNGNSNGGCMVKVAESVATALPGCKESFVSMDCTGDYISVAAASRMLDSTKMALALNKKIRIAFTDAKLHNGYCTATRIDVIK